MTKRTLAAIVMAAVFGLALSAPVGSSLSATVVPTTRCWEGEPGRDGCICFCENYASATANDDQYGNHTWEEQFIDCYVAQGGCEFEELATQESRERSLEGPKAKREPKPQPLRRKP